MRHEKPELSPKNPYHLSRHRYYELKHFCFQYKEWKKALALLDGWQSHGDEVGGIIKGNMPSDPTEHYAMLRAYYSQHIELINDCLAMLEPAIAPYILKGVTEGLSYNQLRARGCPAAPRCTTSSIINSSGFSAKNVGDAKNTGSFMEVR
ncbi:hypothetical protein DXA70_06650 [Faecalibacterium sp. OF04-11AC]|uniref:hypothetical protein n=1 Tax=Faecalibacterium sp. OF04-11AC TaxID=2293109 RepID=UPI000E92DEAA|nr:hypothetical protein [Faecalibacterium sp. OF04-11AC]RGF78683.1 hypothetical protein DXA70_06650 [Faecalibacterium sp. OF04-11AC]